MRRANTKARRAKRVERLKLVQEAVADRQNDPARQPDPIDSPLIPGEAVEIVGEADAPTTSQIFRFRGTTGAVLPPYVAPPESAHAGKVIHPVKVGGQNGKVVGVPVDRLRPVDRRVKRRGHSGVVTNAFRRGYNRIFRKGSSSC